MDARTATSGPTAPTELAQSEGAAVVRSAVAENLASDGLKDMLRERHLGSPVREICTLGSAWGDEFKKENFKARLYHPA
jgi:hypothetical protein